MTDGDLADIVAGLRHTGGDHLGVEAQASQAALPKRLWETLSAFANSPGGGAIILGLDEREGFRATGVKDPKKIQQDLASLCDQMDPPLRAQIRVHRFEGAPLVIAEIPEVDRSQKPCFYRGAGHLNGSFIRVADGDRKLTSYEVQLLMASRGQPRDDEEPVPTATLADLDVARLAGLVNRLKQRSRNLADRSEAEVLDMLKILVRAGGDRVPSLAAMLALGRYPQQFFPALCTQFVVYPTNLVGSPGADDARFLDNRRFDGPISSLVEQLLAALRQHMAQKTMVRGARREDVWQYPETALREALVNALVHRDLSGAARGTAVQVAMFPDRLQVSNPGGLFGPVTLDRLGESGVSATRNATLMRLLEDAPGIDGAPLCENRGSGIGAMIHALRRAGLEPPRFDDRISTFSVTFPNASLLDDDTVGWLQRLGRTLTETQRLGLALLRHGHVLDNTTYRQATGLDSRVATRELGELVEARLVEQIGTRRWATYRMASPATIRRDRRAEIISVLRKRGELSRRDIAQELELSDAAVRQWLAVLRKQGQVDLTGPVRSPTVKYRLSRRKRRT
jgi:ATP-dependent DNA helicase RecG